MKQHFKLNNSPKKRKITLSVSDIKLMKNEGIGRKKKKKRKNH